MLKTIRGQVVSLVILVNTIGCGRATEEAPKLAMQRPTGELQEIDTQLVLEARVCNTPTVEDLLRKGILVDDTVSRTTPLRAALAGGCDDTAAVLLRAGAARYPELLHEAAGLETSETLRLLLKEGADPNTKNAHGVTPLMVASQIGHPELIDLLLAEGADPNAKNADGETPLMVASFHGRSKAIQLLLAAGAHLSLRNYTGLSALDYTGHSDECLENRRMSLPPNADIDWHMRRQTAASLLLAKGATSGCTRPVSP